MFSCVHTRTHSTSHAWAGQINWFPSTAYRNGVFYFLVGYIVLSLSLHNVIAQDREGWGGGGELLVAKLLIANIKKIEPHLCSINLNHLKPTLLKVSGETRWDETGYNVDVWNPPDTGETGFIVQCG